MLVTQIIEFLAAPCTVHTADDGARSSLRIPMCRRAQHRNFNTRWFTNVVQVQTLAR
jgi:hypothetical protein